MLTGLVALLFGILLLLLGPAADLINSAPTFAWKIETKLGDVSGPLQRIQYLTDRIDAEPAERQLTLLEE